jgi:hypothetical protein
VKAAAPAAPEISPAPAPVPVPPAPPVPPAKPAAVRPKAAARGHSSGALPGLLAATALVAIGAAASWYERGIESEVSALAEEVAASVVPDEALVPSAVKGARAENERLAAALSPRFVPRDEPVVALRTIEGAARASGVSSSFSRVEVVGWSGLPEDLRGFETAGPKDKEPQYAAVVATVEASGTWASALAFAAALEQLPLVSRVDAVRLSSADGAWSVTAEVSVAAR